MRHNICLNSGTSKEHPDRSHKTQMDAFAHLAWRGLLCILLSFTHHTAKAGNPGIADEQDEEHDVLIDTLKNEQHAPIQLHPEPVITEENGVYTIFDLQQREHAFLQHADGLYVALNKASGKLTQATNGQFHWTDEQGRRYRFVGSTLALSQYTTTQRINPSLTLQSGPDQQVSTSATNIARATLSKPVECVPPTITLPPEPVSNTDTETQPSDEQPSTPAPTPPKPTTQPNESQQCDTETEGSHTFQTNAYPGPQITLDARPASCESYFVEYYGTDRGFEIEAGLHLHSPYANMQPTVRNFPVVDFMDESRLVVVHSRDLGNRTFNSATRPDALLDQLLKDGEEIQTRLIDVLHEQGTISASERGQSTTINADQIRPVTMQLVIRDGIASADQWIQIEKARDQLIVQYGITLEVVVIP